jgi:phosphoglycerate dehydrogenase-like enzyme
MGTGEGDNRATPVLTFLVPMAFSEEARTRLEAIAPGIEIQRILYQEGPNLRNARSARRVTEVDLASAPVLTDDDWAVLERTTAAVVLDLPVGIPERARALQWVQVIGAGTEHLDVAGLAARGISVTNGAGLAAVSIAEFVLGRLLQIWKDFRSLEQQQREHRWEPLFGRRVAGLTLGIVGLGGIGRATARRARAFDMRVVANRRRAAAGDEDPDVDELFTAGAIDDMLSRCDAVVVAAAATPETMGLFDRTRISNMKPGSVLCNVARGSLVDENAVVDALHSGHLAAAILDVTAEEPTPPDSPLWTAPNCYLSPHCALALDGYEDALLDLTIRNFAHLAQGQPLENLVQG